MPQGLSLNRLFAWIAGTTIVLCISQAHSDPADNPPACTAAEEQALVQAIKNFQSPLLEFFSNVDISDACKENRLNALTINFFAREQSNLCAGESCLKLHDTYVALSDAHFIFTSSAENSCSQEELERISSSEEIWGETNEPCSLSMEITDALQQADSALLSALFSELSVIQEKIDQGLIPYCLLPTSCHQDIDHTNFAQSDCGRDLLRLWIEFPGFKVHDQTKEAHIDTGGFTHLVLAQAFTCAEKAQVGGTCGIYSGANLMAHYCSVPARNPFVQPGTCPQAGPGFTCVRSEELLETVDEIGAWEAQLCHKDKKSKTVICAPAVSNPLLKDQLETQTNLDNANTEGNSVKSARLQKKYKKLERLAAQVYASAYLNEKPKNYKGYTLTGPEGVYMSDMTMAYEHFGFNSVWIPYYQPNAWESVIAELESGHPVQLAVNTREWKGYNGTKDGSHAVVATGYWEDAIGQGWILILDSNFPDILKSFKADKTETYFLQNRGGAVAICPPQDDRAICQENPPSNP